MTLRSSRLPLRRPAANRTLMTVPSSVVTAMSSSVIALPLRIAPSASFSHPNKG